MRRSSFLFALLPILGLYPANGLAQCSNACPGGSITTLPSNGIIAAGTTYCITGPVNNSSIDYTVGGTLIVQSGSLSIGKVTLKKTGVIVVNNSAKLYTANFTGESTAPASTLANVTICTGGYLSITGAFNQWETNFVLNDYAILLVNGSWTSSATDIYAKIGMGALVELCTTLNINIDGFFTETSNSPSYLITGAGATESVVNGWLSTKQNGSRIMWTALAPIAFISHPAAYLCNICGNNSLAPPGTTPGTCGAVANNYTFTVLDLPPSGSYPHPPPVLPSPPAAGMAFPDPATNYVDLRLPGRGAYTLVTVLDNTGRLLQQRPLSDFRTAPSGMTNTGEGVITRLELPPRLPTGIYFLRITGPGATPLVTRVLKADR